MSTPPHTHPGETLREWFLEPLGLSAAALAAHCRMPRSRVSDILTGKRGISADTAMRLAAFFRMEPEAWMALQAAWDLAQVQPDPEIVPLDPPGFLIGPLGATPLPKRRPVRPTLEVGVGPAPSPESLLAAEPAAAHRPVRSVHAQTRYPDGTRALVAEPDPTVADTIEDPQ